VVGVFTERGMAEKAIDELHHAGFTEKQVGILTRGGEVRQARTETGVLEHGAAEGTAAGALTGAALGALAGTLASIFIPGLGLVVTGGILTAILGATAAGAAGGALLGTFAALGLSEDEARFYESELSSGRTIVVVQAADARRAEAQDILRRLGAHECPRSPTSTTRP
jgi:hypothetical protein